MALSYKRAEVGEGWAVQQSDEQCGKGARARIPLGWTDFEKYDIATTLQAQGRTHFE